MKLIRNDLVLIEGMPYFIPVYEAEYKDIARACIKKLYKFHKQGK